ERDDTGVEWLQLGNLGREIVPGERILIRAWRCLLRKRESGIEITAGPIIDNDGMHVRRTWGGSATLKAGRNPFRLDWFNSLRDMNLEMYGVVSNQTFSVSSNLWHETVDPLSGRTNYVPGLQAECYEGYWESVPDFELLQPVKTGVVSNFDLGFRTRDEMVGIRFTGFLEAPAEGTYAFRVRSDDGSLLFFGQPELTAVHLGSASAPAPTPGTHGQIMAGQTERRWTTIEGRAGFVVRKGRGLEFELRSDQ